MIRVKLLAQSIRATITAPDYRWYHHVRNYCPMNHNPFTPFTSQPTGSNPHDKASK